MHDTPKSTMMARPAFVARYLEDNRAALRVGKLHDTGRLNGPGLDTAALLEAARILWAPSLVLFYNSTLLTPWCSV